MSKEKESASGGPGGARRASGGAPKERRDGRGRWSAKRECPAVLRLLRGEDLETLLRELGVTAATLSGWREPFLEGGAANLKAPEANVDYEETQRLKSLVTDLSMSFVACPSITFSNPLHSGRNRFCVCSAFDESVKLC